MVLSAVYRSYSVDQYSEELVSIYASPRGIDPYIKHLCGHPIKAELCNSNSCMESQNIHFYAPP